MRTKSRTTAQLKPGMVIRCAGANPAAFNHPVHTWRQVAKVETAGLWGQRVVTFTDGTREQWGRGMTFDVTRSKAVRNSVKASGGTVRPAPALADALALFAGYARTAVA